MNRCVTLFAAFAATVGATACNDRAIAPIAEPPVQTVSITIVEPAETPGPTTTTRPPRPNSQPQAKARRVVFHPNTSLRDAATLTFAYVWGSGSKDRTKDLQVLLGVTVDGVYGWQTRAAHMEALTFLGIPTDQLPEPPSRSERRFPETSRCPEIEETAKSVGWPERELRTLSYVAYRESRCDRFAYNGKGRDRSYGLMQINTKGSLWEHRRDLCELESREQLFTAEANLSCAYRLWSLSGWAPWNL